MSNSTRKAHHLACRASLGLTALAVLTMSGLAHAAPTPIFFGPTAYLSVADIPAGFYGSGSPSFLENFEDGTLNGGLVGSGSVGRFGLSVDADDGSINGVAAGHSIVNAGFTTISIGAGIALPTAFGVVITSWNGFDSALKFEAFDANNHRLGGFTFNPRSFVNANSPSQHRFVGVQYADGIKRIEYGGTSTASDHIQYGNAVVSTVPEPETYTLLLAGLGLAGFITKQRKRFLDTPRHAVMSRRVV